MTQSKKQKHIVFLLTTTAARFKRGFAQWIGEDMKEIDNTIVTHFTSAHDVESYFQKNTYLNPQNTLIHCRSAHPRAAWTKHLLELQRRGFKAINSAEVVRLTSSASNCAVKLYESGISNPASWRGYRGSRTIKKSGVEISKAKTIQLIIDLFNTDKYDRLVIKPETSMDQGFHVKILNKTTSPTIIEKFLDNMGGSVNLCIQEYVPYLAIYRAIVIGGKCLELSYVDRITEEKRESGDWKVSVCLNDKTMEFVSKPDSQMLRLAEQAQQVIGGKLNYIDIFETKDGYTISEINTACSLKMHEGLAKKANHPQWDISAAIAKYLYKQLP